MKRNKQANERPAEAYERPRMTAIKLSQRLAGWVLSACPNVADRYREGRTYAEIAAMIPGLEDAARSRRIAEGAVRCAVQALLRPDEARDLAREHRRAALARTAGGFGTAAARDFSRRAGRRNIAKHGIDTERLTRAKGQVPWSERERELILGRLLTDPAFRHARGSGRGWPSYRLIAEAVNREIHGGRPVRSVDAVKALLARLWDSRRGASPLEKGPRVGRNRSERCG